MRKELVLLAACATLAGCGQMGLERSEEGESAAAGASAPQGSSDPVLLRQIAQGDMAEVAAGMLAVARADSPAVREYGQLMVEEHSEFLAQGKELAEAKGVQVPVSPSAEHQAAMSKLESLSGERFDSAYMQQMVEDHEKALRLLEQAASEANDPRLRAHAEKAIPRVQRHLQLAQRLTGDLLGSAR